MELKKGIPNQEFQKFYFFLDEIKQCLFLILDFPSQNQIWMANIYMDSDCHLHIKFTSPPHTDEFKQNDGLIVAAARVMIHTVAVYESKERAEPNVNFQLTCWQSNTQL